jgi:hypothetical protein
MPSPVANVPALAVDAANTEQKVARSASDAIAAPKRRNFSRGEPTPD